MKMVIKIILTLPLFSIKDLLSIKHKIYEDNTIKHGFSLIFAGTVAYIYLVEEFALLNECLDCQMEKSSSFCDDYLL